MPINDITTLGTTPKNIYIDSEIIAVEKLIFAGELILPHCFSNDCNMTNQVSEFFTSNKLIKKTDIFGREQNFDFNSLMLYIYENGTIAKKIIIESY